MKLRIHFAWPLACAFGMTLGCQPAPGQRVRSDMRVFQREQATDRLIDRGRGFAAVGDTTRAQQYFEAALENGADEARILPLLLAVCVRDGRYRLAVDYARRYVARHPSDHKVRFVLGTLYAALGESVEAQSELEMVTTVEEQNADAQYALAVVLRDQRADLSAAERHFREYLRLAPRGEHAEEARASIAEEVP